MMPLKAYLASDKNGGEVRSLLHTREASEAPRHVREHREKQKATSQNGLWLAL